MTEPVGAGRAHWLDAGQELLRRGGIGAVKLQALTEELGRTTGSFYHHFEGMGAYLDALARYYGADQVHGNLDRLAGSEPMDRLLGLASMARDLRMAPLDAAMRDWAGSNRLAADAVRAADDQLLTFLVGTFADLGHGVEQARLRAHLLLAFGVARVVPPWKTSVDARELLAILVPADGAPDR